LYILYILNIFTEKFKCKIYLKNHMNRKLIKQGTGVLTITIPKKWVTKHQLTAGDELDVLEKENTLIFSTSKIATLPEAYVNVENFNERTIRNVLNQTYRKGFDKIILTYNSPDQVEIVEEITRQTLIGFEVVEKDKTQIIIENIAEPTADKYAVILRKLFLMIQLEIEEIAKAITINSYDPKKRKSAKEMIDSYTNLTRRLIIKYELDGKNSYLLYYAVSLLSLIHHAYFYLHSFQSKHRKKLKPQTVQLLMSSKDLFSMYYHGFYKLDLRIANDIALKKQQLLVSVEEQLQLHKCIDNVALYYLGEAVRLIQMSSTVLFGLATTV